MISTEGLENLDILVKSGFITNCDNPFYKLYSKYVDILSFEDILSVKSICLTGGFRNLEIERLLLDLFLGVMQGSLTVDLIDKDGNNIYNIDFKDNDFKDIFEIISLSYTKDFDFKPIFLIKEDSVFKYACFQKYATAALEIRNDFKIRDMSNTPIDFRFLNLIEGEENFKKAFNQVIDNPPLIDGKYISPNFQQKLSVIISLLRNLTVITGGPGTGKTTVIFTIIRVLLRLGINVSRIALAAPTGRAAFRMRESLKSMSCGKCNIDEEIEHIESMTIHRLLEIKPNGFYRNSCNPIDADVIIIDEVSMVDVCLMWDLIKAIPKKAKLIFIGDPEQLPSVDAGTVMTDLSGKDLGYSADFAEYIKKIIKEDNKNIISLARGKKSSDYIVKLTENHRSVSELKDVHMAIRGYEEGILGVSNSLKDISIKKQSFRLGQRNILLNWEPLEIQDSLKVGFLEISAIANKGDFIRTALDSWFISSYMKGHNSYVNQVKDLMESLDFQGISEFNVEIRNIFKIINDYRLLVAVKNTMFGNKSINFRFLNIYLSKVLPKSGNKIICGTPIMISKNDHEKELFNGDVGVILKDKKGVYKAVFEKDGKFIDYAPDSLSEYETAFAITVHKSQGSEYKHVFMVLPSMNESNRDFLSKEILYTGITRAKESIAVMTNRDTLDYMASNPVKRSNGIPIWRK